jgi:hypothetical protein
MLRLPTLRRKFQMKLVFALMPLALMFLKTAAAQTCAGKPLHDVEVSGIPGPWRVVASLPLPR